MSNGQKRIVGTIWLVLFSVFLVILVQDFAGGPLYRTIPLDLTDKAKVSGESVRIRLHERYRDELTAERIVVFEDGVPLPIAANSVRSVSKDGHGRYRAKPGYVYFSATDGSEPMTNGRQYSIRVPQQVKPPVKWILLTLLTLSGFWILRGEKPVALRKMPGNAAVAGGIALLAVVIGLYHLKADADITTEFMLIKGKPYSDADGWMELGISLKEGNGFTGGFKSHRPFYPLFLGSVFTFFGDSLLVAKLTNIALLAMGASFAYLLGAYAGSRLAGLAVAAWVLLDPSVNLLVHQTLSEGLGFALGAMAACLLAGAFQTGRRSLFFTGGLLFAMSNLARPFLLFGAFFFGIIFLVLLVRKNNDWPWKRILHSGLLFSAGILIVFFPWCLRQKIVNGTWSPSINSSIMLYAGARPDIGHSGALNSEHYAEAERLGLEEYTRDWNTYYSERYSDAVAADPAAYLGRVFRQTLAFFDEFSLNQPWRMAFLVFAVCLAIAWNSWRFGSPLTMLLLPLAVIGVPLLCELPLLALVLGSSAILMFAPGSRRRWPVYAVALSLILGASILSGMIAGFALNRSAFIASWIVFFLVFAALAHLIELTAAPAKDREFAKDSLPVWNRFTKISLGVYFFIVIAGLAVMGLRSTLVDMKDSVPEVPGLAAQAQENNPKLAGRELAEKFVRLGDYRFELKANEDTGHVSTVFAPRKEPRAVISPRLLYADGNARWYPVQFCGATLDQFPKDGTFVLVAVKTEAVNEHGKPMLMWDAVSLTPYDPETRGIDAGGQMTFPLPEEFENPL